MQLLDFIMPSFTRINYVGLEAKEKWEPKIRAAKKFHLEMEYHTVVHGLRSCLTDHLHVNDFHTSAMRLADHGLMMNPVFHAPVYSQFSRYEIPPLNPNELIYYSVISKDPALLNEFREAELREDYTTVGKLLGYPECCIQNFIEKREEKYSDMTWHQAGSLPADAIVSQDAHTIRVKSDPMANPIYLNPLQIGLSMHLPCSLECERTKAIAHEHVQLAKDLHLEEEIENVLEILDLPVQWDCTKGIAVISTPVFKASFNSLPTTERYVVQRESDYYPEDSGSGLVFPWKNKLCK